MSLAEKMLAATVQLCDSVTGQEMGRVSYFVFMLLNSVDCFYATQAPLQHKTSAEELSHFTIVTSLLLAESNTHWEQFLRALCRFFVAVFSQKRAKLMLELSLHHMVLL